MKHSRERYNRKQKYKNKHYDEGERRRGKRFYEEDDEEEIVVKPKKEPKKLVPEPKKEVTISLKPPQSLRPPVKKTFKAPEKRSAEEIRLIKEDFARRFKEGLRERKNSEDAD